ncbi:hypothetical protein KDL45_11005 [bacterium]|nr:hypothetical protein [bacterium]MCB9476201.1 hypothetical protein [Deltaproteobacteria bacterium]MCB9479869.1 hypothetical protein [Deltaproteobacteria bacterium]
MPLPNKIEFPYLLTISEGSSASDNCPICEEYQGEYEILNPEDLRAVKLPPYHPNCVCQVKAQHLEMTFDTKYGTARQMAVLVETTNSKYKTFTSGFHEFGFEAWLAYWATFFGIESFFGIEKAVIIACQDRALNFLHIVEQNIPAQGWYKFELKRGTLTVEPEKAIYRLKDKYVIKFKSTYPHRLNFVHYWVELVIDYFDANGDKRRRRIKYDPYYGDHSVLE